MTIQDIINEIFESQEMKDYLCENIEKIDIKEVIAASPMITVQRKLEILEWLAENEDLEKELEENGDVFSREFIIEDSYAEIVKNTREALNELYDTEKSSVFLVRFLASWGMDDDEYTEAELLPFTSYEKALQYMRKQEEEYKEYRVWFDVEKWEQDENGNLEKKWTYVVLKGQVTYFGHDIFRLSECSQNKDVNLPVPFKAGDILEIQDMPFARKRHVLILDIGDNKDCCSVWHLYIDDDGCIEANAFKHGHIYSSWYATSPLYSAKTFHGALEDEEEVLYIIKDFMNKLPECEEKWKQLFEIFTYISEKKMHSRDITEEYLENVRVEVLTREKQ